MANYSLVANSKFQPFSYAELLAPVMAMSNYHEKLAEEYDNLSKQADVLEIMSNNDLDKKSGSYDRYKSYSESLKREADELYKFGLTTESRQRLTDLRRRYNTDIVPIQNAWSKREKEADTQMQARLQNPSLMFTRDASTTSLDDYIKNPAGGYGVISGANITAQMTAMAKTLEKKILDGSIKKEDIDPFTYDYIRSYGLTPDIVRNWRNNETLSTMFNQVLKANGVTEEALQGSLNAQNIIDKSTAYAEMGMWNAIGEDKATTIENFGTRLVAQKAAELDTYRKKKEIDAIGDGNDGFDLDSSLLDLPMAGADTSNAKAQEDAMKILGYEDNGNTLKMKGSVGIKVSHTTDEARNHRESTKREFNKLNLMRKSRKLMPDEEERYQYLRHHGASNGEILPITTTKTANLYNADGTIKTRKQFVAQAGNSERAKKAFNEYFDKMVEASKTLGMYGKIYKHTDLTNQYNQLRNNNAASFAEVRPLNYGKDTWNPTSKAFVAKEITSYRGGKPIYDSKSVSLGSLLEEYGDNISAYWSNVDGQKGIILAATKDKKDHRYFINTENMQESNVQTAQYYFNVADTYQKAGNTDLAKKATQVALRALHSGLTLYNDSQKQDINRQPTLKQSGLLEE